VAAIINQVPKEPDMFLVFALWFGLESFGQSRGHGPSDIVLLGYVLSLAVCSARGGGNTRSVILISALFGGTTIMFQLLTGGIPLGLALLVGGVRFSCRVADILRFLCIFYGGREYLRGDLGRKILLIR
jgi:hypothetical protein